MLLNSLVYSSYWGQYISPIARLHFSLNLRDTQGRVLGGWGRC